MAYLTMRVLGTVRGPLVACWGGGGYPRRYGPEFLRLQSIASRGQRILSPCQRRRGRKATTVDHEIKRLQRRQPFTRKLLHRQIHGGWQYQMSMCSEASMSTIADPGDLVSSHLHQPMSPGEFPCATNLRSRDSVSVFEFRSNSMDKLA